MSEANKLAVGYVRVSSEEQAAHGVSLEAQRKFIRQWASLKGFKLLGIEEDAGISAKRADNRPGLQRAIAQAVESHAALVVYKLDRFARSTVDAIMLSDKLSRSGADLVSITESVDTTTAIGRMFFTMMAAFAQMERDLISERTQVAMNHKRSKGERLGRVPYGWTVNGDGKTLAEIPAEQAVLARIHAAAAQGKRARGIAAELNAEKIPSKSGKAWSFRTIQEIINRSREAQHASA